MNGALKAITSAVGLGLAEALSPLRLLLIMYPGLCLRFFIDLGFILAKLSINSLLLTGSALHEVPFADARTARASLQSGCGSRQVSRCKPALGSIW